MAKIKARFGKQEKHRDFAVQPCGEDSVLGMSFFFFNFLNQFIYFERDRESEWGRAGRERESEAGSTLSAHNPMWGSKSHAVRS